MKKIYLFVFVICGAHLAVGQPMTGPQLLEKSIAYHDPQGVWGAQKVKLQLKETRPDGGSRMTQLFLHPKEGSFVLEQTRGEDHLWRKVVGKTCEHRLNKSATFSKDEARKHRLNCDHSQTIRGYYEYLWGLPMKLKDEGTIIEQSIQAVTFRGENLLALKVTYTEEVGKDIWYFYFDPHNYALRAYRFYHDEAVNDGEYITLEGEERIGEIRYPKIRKWYVNKDDKYLGADELMKVP
ncbi:MAG: DUF6503 family protein [Bacteroidota bacterium]